MSIRRQIARALSRAAGGGKGMIPKGGSAKLARGLEGRQKRAEKAWNKGDESSAEELGDVARAQNYLSMRGGAYNTKSKRTNNAAPVSAVKRRAGGSDRKGLSSLEWGLVGAGASMAAAGAASDERRKRKQQRQRKHEED